MGRKPPGKHPKKQAAGQICPAACFFGCFPGGFRPKGLVLLPEVFQGYPGGFDDKGGKGYLCSPDGLLYLVDHIVGKANILRRSFRNSWEFKFSGHIITHYIFYALHFAIKYVEYMQSKIAL